MNNLCTYIQYDFLLFSYILFPHPLPLHPFLLSPLFLLFSPISPYFISPSGLSVTGNGQEGLRGGWLAGQSKGPASELNRVGLFQLLDEVVGAEGGLIAVAIRRAAASRLVSAPRLLRQSPGFGQWRWNCSVSSQVGVGARPR